MGMSGVSGLSTYGSSQKTTPDAAGAGDTVWSKQSNPYQAAYDFFTSAQTGKDAKGADVDTAAQVAKNLQLKGSLMPADYNRVSPKYTDGLKDLYKQNLSPDDFKAAEKKLRLTCTPRPGLKQQFMAKLTNLNNLQKAGKLSKADFGKALDSLKSDFKSSMQLESDTNSQICNVDSFDYQDACSKYNEAMKAAQDG
jgi:hypothetical protein